MATVLEKKYLQACLVGDIDTVICMIKKENKSLKNNKFLKKCLKSACSDDHIKVCEIILQHKDLVRDYSSDFISDACTMGKINMVKFYLEKSPFNYNIRSMIQYLDSACRSGNIDLIEFIVDKVKEDHSNWECNWNDCLYHACFSGSIKCVNLCIKNGANNWDAGLHNACCGNSVEIVKLMIKNGANPMVENGGIHIPISECLEQACRIGNLEIINILVNLIPQTGLNYWDGRDMWDAGLHGACRGGHLDLVELMITKGAEDFNTGMQCACTNGHIEIMKLMILKGGTNWNGCLYGACYGGYEGYVKIAKYMIGKGATVSIFNECFERVCFNGDLELAKILVERGANNFNEGLLNACRGGHVDLVYLMIEYGANNFNESLNNCKENVVISNLLISKGADVLHCLRQTNDFKLYCLYCKFKKIEHIDKCIDLLREYPPYVLMIWSRISKNYNCIKKLPTELFRFLGQYL